MPDDDDVSHIYGPSEADPAGEALPAADPAEQAAQAAQALALLVRGLANVAFRRMGAPELADEEADEIAIAGMAVASHYDIALPPKAAAWLALGVAVAAPVLSRLEYLRRRQPAAAPTERAADAAPLTDPIAADQPEHPIASTRDGDAIGRPAPLG